MVIRYAHLRSRFARCFYAVSAVVAAQLSPSLAHAQAVAADPAGSGPIVAALGWLQGTLLGNVATAVAVMA
ncbi:conjugal transfer protein trbc, partial [Sphingomonas sp. LH128]